MDERRSDVAHLEETLIGDLLMDNVDDGQDIVPVLLHADGQLVESQDNPLQFLLADAVSEGAHLGRPLQQVQAAHMGQLLLLRATVAELTSGYMNSAW